MQALILAAGLGRRMGPLTQQKPKPLMAIGQSTLIERNIAQLQEAGIKDIVINVHYQKQAIIDYLGYGEHLGVNIAYSHEEVLLDTGGAVVQALGLLREQPFLVLSADIVTEFPFATLMGMRTNGAHLVLVQNPEYHPKGDFSLSHGRVCLPAGHTYTYANIGLYHPSLFAGLAIKPYSLASLLQPNIAQGLVSGMVYEGPWFNVGTEQELNAARHYLDVQSC